jgi:K+ transporter
MLQVVIYWMIVRCSTLLWYLLSQTLPPLLLLHASWCCPAAAAVLSAVSGLQVKAGLSQDAVIGLTCAILVVLFMVQSYGTQRIGVMFAPVVLLWFLSNVLVAMYNIHAYEGAAIFRAMSPHYIGGQVQGSASLLTCWLDVMLVLGSECTPPLLCFCSAHQVFNRTA